MSETNIELRETTIQNFRAFAHGYVQGVTENASYSGDELEELIDRALGFRNPYREQLKSLGVDPDSVSYH